MRFTRHARVSTTVRTTQDSLITDRRRTPARTSVPAALDAIGPRRSPRRNGATCRSIASSPERASRRSSPRRSSPARHRRLRSSASRPRRSSRRSRRSSNRRTSYPSQPLLPTVPDDPTDASIARGVTPYDEIAPFLNTLMAQSDRISAQVVGQSTLGRDIHLVTVTAEETPAQTAKQKAWRELIKADPDAAAENQPLMKQYKVPIWFNANIHGNEWEGTDGVLNYIEYLATAPWPEVRDLLQDYRFYFTVTNNPDGRALGQRANADGFDINRDMITGATPESRIIRDLSSVIQPTFFIDLHGYTSVLQVEPCGPPARRELRVRPVPAARLRRRARDRAGRRRREHPGQHVPRPRRQRDAREHREDQDPLPRHPLGLGRLAPHLHAAVRRLPGRDHEHRGAPARSHEQPGHEPGQLEGQHRGRGRRDRDRGRLRGRQRRHAARQPDRDLPPRHRGRAARDRSGRRRPGERARAQPVGRDLGRDRPSTRPSSRVRT